MFALTLIASGVIYLFALTLIASGVIFPECRVGSSTSMLQVNMGVSQSYQNWTLVYSVSGNQ